MTKEEALKILTHKFYDDNLDPNLTGVEFRKQNQELFDIIFGQTKQEAEG